MIAGTWNDPMPTEPGPERDQWLRARGWDSYEEWLNRNGDEVSELSEDPS